ncbi:major facilitator superfamily domain-containing protein [Mycena capillaripes]|nr:major facilitator superfamily domain-containing protein [Mycena capillaripes]
MSENPENPVASLSPEKDKPQAPESAPTSKYLHGTQLLVALVGVLLSVFLTGLDQTVVANALPIIASVFNALANLTWVPTAFLITQVACLPLFDRRSHTFKGQLPKVFPIKWIFLFTVTIFELGSLLSAVSPNFGFLIFSRAFQGVGAGGIFVSSLVMIADIAPLEDRPKYLGALGAVFALGTVIGPLVGGGLVDKVSWRWCFYINLPLSVPTFLASVIFIRMQTGSAKTTNEAAGASPLSFFARIAKIDIIGFILILGFTTCLVVEPWKSADVIATLVLSGVLIGIFGAWQRFKKEAALVPLILLQTRTIATGENVSTDACTQLNSHIPQYFQAVHNHSAVKAGVDLLPLSIALILSAGISGGVISRTGNYWLVMFFGPWLAVIAFGLFFMLDEHTSAGKYVGYQILAGAGIGTTTQVIVIAAQADVGPAHVAQASALVTFVQWLGGIIGLSVAGTIFQNKLASGLREFAPNAPFDELRQSVTALAKLTGSEHDGAVHAYVKALQLVFLGVAVPASALCSISTLLVRNRNILREKEAALKAAEAEGAEEKREVPAA